jgi:hypothetical protein
MLVLETWVSLQCLTLVSRVSKVVLAGWLQSCTRMRTTLLLDTIPKPVMCTPWLSLVGRQGLYHTSDRRHSHPFAQVYTGQLPFPDIRGDIKVIQDVLHQDLRPPKPADDPAWLGLTNEIWDLMQDGWAKAPSARPGAERFEEILASHVVVPAVEETKLRLLQETLDES